MATLNQKLQIKPGQRLGVFYPPPGIFETISAGLEGCEVMAGAAGKMDAVLVFVTALAEVPARWAEAQDALLPGGLMWMAYAKGGSGIKTDVNRDRLFEAVKPLGWLGIRIVALDDTWSALRFRPAELVGK